MDLTQLNLKQELKQLIIIECDKEDDFDACDILDDELLFGRKSRINLDSLDALQLALVLKQKFGIKIEGSRETRKHLKSVDAIAEFILSHSPKES